MNTCDTCRFWKSGEGWYCPKTFGYCTRFVEQWQKSAYPKKDSVLRPNDGPLGHGDRGEPASLKTGPKFGCVHHAPIDTARKSS